MNGITLENYTIEEVMKLKKMLDDEINKQKQPLKTDPYTYPQIYKTTYPYTTPYPNPYTTWITCGSGANSITGTQDVITYNANW